MGLTSGFKVKGSGVPRSPRYPTPGTLDSSVLSTMLCRIPVSYPRFQCRIHDVLCSKDGIINIADDIIVMGRGKSPQAAIHDHGVNILALLQHLTRHKLKLNPDNIKFKSHTAPFMGHILTTDGLKPSKEIAKAVLEMPKPQDKVATRRFLGTIIYLSKFCPNLSEIVHPLWVLTHVRQDFIRADQHTKAFNEAKQLVSTAPYLRYF